VDRWVDEWKRGLVRGCVRRWVRGWLRGWSIYGWISGILLDGWVDGQAYRGGSIHVKLSIPKRVLNMEANQGTRKVVAIGKRTNHNIRWKQATCQTVIPCTKHTGSRTIGGSSGVRIRV
jgi:hypothetical protein